MRTSSTWLDRAIGWVSPRHELSRLQARAAVQVFNRYYEAGEVSRRTKTRAAGDPNAATGVTLGRLRDAARHLTRNNGFASAALGIIGDDTVGWGIQASDRASRWKAWAGSTEIDSDGRCDLSGLEQLVIRTTAESGECLARRRFRRPSDGLAIPLQIQVFEPDYIDSSMHRVLPNGGRIIRGIEFDAIGRRAAYWLFREHPGSTLSSLSSARRLGISQRVPASEILHIFRHDRPGQVRGASWYAPVLIRFSDLDEFSDATLMKQKIAACLAVITSDVDGSNARLGAADATNELHDVLEPGLIANVAPGRSVDVVNPPSVREYSDYVDTTLEEIAAGLGVTPEDITGDYSKMNFSSARMSRLRHYARVYGWRWRMLVPQFLNPVRRWAAEATALAGGEQLEPMTDWTAPPIPMIEPDKEGLAIQRNIRTGIMTPSEALRERGYIPAEFWDEYQRDFEDLDKRGLVVDADARKMNQSGQRQSEPAEPLDPPTASNKLNGKAAPRAQV